MKTRSLTTQNDWVFGSGLNAYAQGNVGIDYAIRMSLQTFLGECFFATNVGIDWFNLLGGKSQLAISLAVNTTLLNTEGVTGLLQTSTTLDPVTRQIRIVYAVQTVYSVLQSSLVYNIDTTGL